MAKVAKKPAAKRLMTRAGFTRLAAEHDELLLVERPKVVAGITVAAAEGDRSENAEYIYGKKRLRELDKRLRYLLFLLREVRLVDPENLCGDVVCFGSTVTVRGEDEVEKSYTIVGEGEAEWRNQEISFKSPVARALIGKKVGDFIIAQRPAGEIELEIVDLKFGGRPYTEPPPAGTGASLLAMPALAALPDDVSFEDEEYDASVAEGEDESGEDGLD